MSTLADLQPIERRTPVERRTVTGDDARFFTLYYVTDTHARVALRAYADSAEQEYPELAARLRGFLTALEEPQ